MGGCRRLEGRGGVELDLYLETSPRTHLLRASRVGPRTRLAQSSNTVCMKGLRVAVCGCCYAFGHPVYSLGQCSPSIIIRALGEIYLDVGSPEHLSPLLIMN